MQMDETELWRLKRWYMAEVRACLVSCGITEGGLIMNEEMKEMVKNEGLLQEELAAKKSGRENRQADKANLTVFLLSIAALVLTLVTLAMGYEGVPLGLVAVLTGVQAFNVAAHAVLCFGRR